MVAGPRTPVGALLGASVGALLGARLDLLPIAPHSCLAPVAAQGPLQQVIRLPDHEDLSDVDARSKAEEELSYGVQRLIALAENYPDLKANENFLNLQNELVETENYLQFARRYYNGSVRDYNTMTETVPSNFVAGVFGFEGRSFFQKLSDDAASVPVIKFGSVE